MITRTAFFIVKIDGQSYNQVKKRVGGTNHEFGGFIKHKDPRY